LTQNKKDFPFLCRYRETNENIFFIFVSHYV
jgi:hypothetical protein